MAKGFGNYASSWAGRLPSSTALIAADLNRCPTALAYAAEQKRAGKNIAGTVLAPEVRAMTAMRNAAAILGMTSDYDEGAELFTALALEKLESNGVNQRDWIKVDATASLAAREFLSCCDLLVSRSATETQRLSDLVKFLPDSVVHAAPYDPRVPPASRSSSRRHERIVVWAPDSSRDDCALLAFALEPLRLPISIVCSAGGPPFVGLHARFFAARDGGAQLAKAAVIIDGSLQDPGTALALAQYEVPLAAARTSGAHEWLRPVHVYAPWNARSVFEAAMAALGGSAPRPSRNNGGVSEIATELDACDRALPTTGPLVSIVLPTFNRRDRLRKALESVSNQRYENLEIVVVDDAGEDVADIVAASPLAKLITNEHNLGVTGSINVGIAAARGEYVGFLADDDFLQPDHVSRMVAALERSGLDVAHSKELAVHYDVAFDGSLSLQGHHIGAPHPTYPAEMLCENRIGGPSVMLRRRVLVAAGLFDETMRHGSDFEMWMRLSRTHDFVFVNHVTAHVSMRNDRSQLSSVSGIETADLMTKIYAKHPVKGRPQLERIRGNALAVCRQQAVLRSHPAIALQASDLTELQIR